MDKVFIKKILATSGIVIAISLVLLLVGSAFNVFLLVFAGALMAIFFRSIGAWIHQKLKIPMSLSLVMSFVLVLGVLIGAGFLAAPRISSQFQQLQKKAPQGIKKIKKDLKGTTVGNFILKNTSNSGTGNALKNKQVRHGIKKFFSTTFGVLGDIYVIFFFGIFFTVNSMIYIKGFSKLFPKKGQHRVVEVLDYSGTAVKKWLFGKIISMFIVGILTSIGLWILGVPLAFILGILTGFLSFIPNFGPLIALIPAVAVAITIGTTKALYVVLVFAGIQALESNLITPFIQKKNVSLPFAMILFSQVLLGVYTGALGLILATPLMVLVIVWVQMLYIHDILHEHNVKLLGQH
jgi:predicted PurR-regulated permease PerM